MIVCCEAVRSAIPATAWLLVLTTYVTCELPFCRQQPVELNHRKPNILTITISTTTRWLCIVQTYWTKADVRVALMTSVRMRELQVYSVSPRPMHSSAEGFVGWAFAFAGKVPVCGGVCHAQQLLCIKAVFTAGSYRQQSIVVQLLLLLLSLQQDYSSCVHHAYRPTSRDQCVIYTTDNQQRN